MSEPGRTGEGPAASAAARLAGALLGLALAGGLAWGSRLPYTAEPADAARLRLSWRALGEPVEACRTPSPEELAALPPHMRRTEICERRLSPFRLQVSVDGASVFDGELRASGAREDRPTYVFHEFDVTPGRHALSVRFREQRPADAPPGIELALDTILDFAPRQVQLVSRAGADESLQVLSD